MDDVDRNIKLNHTEAIIVPHRDLFVVRWLTIVNNNYIVSRLVKFTGLSLLWVVLGVSSVSVYANEFLQQAGNQLQQQLQSTKSENDTETDADNLVDYALQKLDIVDEENQQQQGAEEEKSFPTKPLLAENELTGETNANYYVLDKLNSGLPRLATAPNLETPLSTLEFFNSANLQKNFALAGYALNLNLIPQKNQKNQAADLAKKLDYLMNEKGLYVFDDIPDRPDGLIEPELGTSNPIHGIPRRSIKLGSIDYKDRKVPLYLQRVRVGDSAPVWVFSSQTVANINVLYDIHKPAKFEQFLPQALKAKVLGVGAWEVLVLLIFMLITMGVSYVISNGVTKLVSVYSNVMTSRSDVDELSLGNKGLTDLFSKLTVPLTVTISFSLMFALVSGSLPKIEAVATSTRPVIWMCLVLSALWLGIRGINFFANRYQDYRIDSLTEEQFDTQRTRMTYVSIFRRIFIFVMVMGGLWISLAEFTDIEGLGTTLLTSAGIAGAIIGIAAQPTLGNIIAGFQVAITQPIRIGDTVFVDDIWCEVEDLRYTYAVLKTWDDRRLIVPMKYFVTEVVENWSHTSTNQSSAVHLYVDYGADIEAIEQKFCQIAKAHELWDEEVEPEMQVTAVSEDTITLRGKVSADGPLNAWVLECDVRKQMLAYINEHHRNHLPTDRITFASRS